MSHDANWYDYPEWYDLSFRDETRAECDFFTAACRRYVSFPVRRVLEPGCGSGRLVMELTRRGYAVTAFDLSEPALDYLRKRLKRVKRRAHVFRADMADFSIPKPVDAALNTMNTFRHLLTERDAREHLRCVARAVRPGGIYVLGFHLLPLDADEHCIERWSASSGRRKVTVTLRVLKTNRRRRIENIRISVLGRTPRREIRFRHEFPLRMYTAAQFRRLLRGVPEWQFVDIFDFWYNIEEPLRWDDEITDSVFILRRR